MGLWQMPLNDYYFLPHILLPCYLSVRKSLCANLIDAKQALKLVQERRINNRPLLPTHERLVVSFKFSTVFVKLVCFSAIVVQAFLVYV